MVLAARRALLAGQVRTYATWSSTDKHASITVSGGNLVATGPGVGSTIGSIRSTIGKSAGKWFWEVTITTLGVDGQSHGAADGAEDLDAGAALGNLDGLRVYNSGGNKFKPSTAYGASYTTGDVIGIALDMDAGTITAYKNGVSQGVIVSGLSGTYYAYSNLPNTAGGTAPVCTANFGATAFAYAVPAGHNPGLYAS